MTIGELRASVAGLGDLAWNVAPELSDDSPLPETTTGGSDVGRMAAAEAPQLDIPKLLAMATANPQLRTRRAEVRTTHVREPVVDWRNRWGGRWLTRIKSQGGCSNCWAFATTAVVETMVRIEHGVWSKRSEGDLRDSWGGPLGQNWVVRDGPKSTPCSHGAGTADALDWLVGYGIADPDCYPYVAKDQVYNPTADRGGRTVRIGGYTALDVEDAKMWIDTVGPVTASLDAYSDLAAYRGSMPYRRAPGLTKPAAHDLLIVGYDDIQQAWIVRNSWGGTWGTGGYGLIAYGECKIDDHAKLGVRLTDPDPWTRRRLHNGIFLESSEGPDHRNFELVRGTAPRATHVWRDGGDGGGTWHLGATLENPVDPVAGGGCVGHPALTATTWNRNLEAVYWEASGRLRWWWRDQTNRSWHDGGPVGPTDVQGFPGFIQGNFGAPGHLEIVVRRAGGELQHWWRDSDARTWRDAGTITDHVKMSGPSLVQANIGVKGNFYVVAVSDWGTLQLWWCDNDHGAVWKAGEVFGAHVGETPVCMIQGQFGAVDEEAPGNFELCVAVDGHAQHWWRDNSAVRVESPRADVANPAEHGRIELDPPVKGRVLGGGGDDRIEDPPDLGRVFGPDEPVDDGAHVVDGPRIDIGALFAPRPVPRGVDRWVHEATFGDDVKHVWGLVQGSFSFNLEVVLETNAGALQHWYRDHEGWHFLAVVPA